MVFIRIKAIIEVMRRISFGKRTCYGITFHMKYSIGIQRLERLVQMLISEQLFFVFGLKAVFTSGTQRFECLIQAFSE